MSLEQALAENTAALKENTAALKAAGGKPAAAAAASASSTKAKPPAPAPAPAAAKVDRAAVTAALEVLKEKKGVDAAKKVIKEAGGVEKRADIPEDKFQEVIDAAKAATDATEEQAGDPDDL